MNLYKLIIMILGKKEPPDQWVQKDFEFSLCEKNVKLISYFKSGNSQSQMIDGIIKNWKKKC